MDKGGKIGEFGGEASLSSYSWMSDFVFLRGRNELIRVLWRECMGIYVHRTSHP